MLEIFTETLEQIVTKSHKILILDGKETNKAKLEIFKFLRKSAESQGYSLLIKLAEIVPLIKLAEIVPSMEIQ